MHRGAVCPPFLARYVWHYPFPLQENEMAEAAGLVVGEHDFTSFAAVDPERVERTEKENRGHGGAQRNAEGEVINVRTIYSSAWTREGDELIYTVRGTGFLHHMVRNLVGTVLLIGKGTLTPGDFRRILASCNRSAAGPTAPASGLYLVGVEYG